MYVLEYKSLYIPHEELTKNRTFQSYRWKQYAVCEERGPLEQIRAAQKRPKDWRIIPRKKHYETSYRVLACPQYEVG